MGFARMQEQGEPRRLGRYQLIERIGHGGMAEVYRARAFGASGFEKQVAIKVVRPELRGVSDYQRLLIDEARLGARLAHRNLVQVHDLGVDGGVYFAVMDYVDGADLATLSARGGTPQPALALWIAEELALALAYLHGVTDDGGRALGLVHRDVSPSNVLVSRAGDVKLSDLGIAKATRLREVTVAGVRKGTYAYMSPEQVTGDPLGPRSDQFGLGVLVCELVTGARPYDGATILETLDNIRRATPPALAGVREEVAAVIRRCVARDPADRFDSADAVRRALRRARCAISGGDAVGSPELAAEVSRLVRCRHG